MRERSEAKGKFTVEESLLTKPRIDFTTRDRKGEVRGQNKRTTVKSPRL